LAKLRYLLFHKPYDVLSQFTPEPGSKARTLKDFIDVPGVYAVGRLDRDSEGLLLLTDDGALQHRLTDPRFEHPRTYWVQVEGVPDLEAMKRLGKGVQIQDYVTRPAKVAFIEPAPEVPARTPPVRYRKSIPTSWIAITLTEGKNRQVRRMTAAVGFPTLRLLRVASGEIRLGDLAPGAWRDLTADEVRSLLR
jgi:23S rRNA pseudouridine2457 synthase